MSCKKCHPHGLHFIHCTCRFGITYHRPIGKQHRLLSTMIFTTLSYCITFLTLAIAVYFWKQRRSQMVRLPPGPRTWPIVGSIPSIVWQFYRSGLRLPPFLQLLGYQFGPIFRVNLFGRDIIVLCDYDRIKEAFEHPNLNDRAQGRMISKVIGGKSRTGLSDI